MSIKAIVWDIGGVILDEPKIGDFCFCGNEKQSDDCDEVFIN